MRIDFAADDPDVNVYKLMTSVVVPRPIAWVSTLSSAGVVNLAPHSFYNVVCARPPIIYFSSVGGKDTLRNVEDTGEFVVSLAYAPMIEAVNNSAARFDPEDSEAGLLDIELEPSLRVKPPRVAGSPVAIECTLHSTTNLGNSTMVLGDVRMISVAEDVMVDGHPEFARLQPLARLGKEEWGMPGEVVSIHRPATPDEID